MNPTTLKFYVKEDGADFSISHMSGQETASIEECVSDLLPSCWGADCWFEADTCLYDEDEDEPEPDYGLVRCFTHNPKPKNGSQMELRLPYAIPTDVLAKYAGKTFRVHPRQFGVNPWGAKVEITFEAITPPPPPPVPPTPQPQPEPAPSPAPAPAPAPQPSVVQDKAGIKVSDLIRAALKAH